MKKSELITVAAAVALLVQVSGFAGEPLGDISAGNAQPTVPGGDQPVASSPQSSASEKALGENARALAAKILPERQKRDLEFKKASALFPDFCQHWEENLRERERLNLSKLVFALIDGLHTATYTGYGEVKTCEAHQSKEGFSIGKITYEELTYSLTGNTPEEAARGEKKPISTTTTTEIFRWEKNKWFY